MRQPPSAAEPADPFARIAAKGIDLLLALMAAGVAPPFGTLLGIAYLFVADALFEGRSVGKRVLRLRVVDVHSGRPASLRQSLLRNFDVAGLLLLAALPFLGLILAIVLGLFTGGVELYAIFHDPQGRRIGDLLAETRVVGRAMALDPLADPGGAELPPPN